jgi:hypothetical protein
MNAGFMSERLLLTLWVGCLWAIGYLAVPMAFINLADVNLAANFAGKLFFAVNVLGIGCSIILFISKVFQHKGAVMHSWRFFVLMIMFLLSVVFIAYLLPEVSAIRQLDWRANPELTEQFNGLHSLSENTYLLLSLLGLALVISNDNTVMDNKNGEK